MASPDSDGSGLGPRVGGTTYDWARVMLTFGTVLFTVVAVGTAIESQYFPVVDPLLSAVAAVIFGCLAFYVGRKRPRQVGQDFNF